MFLNAHARLAFQRGEKSDMALVGAMLAYVDSATVNEQLFMFVSANTKKEDTDRVISNTTVARFSEWSSISPVPIVVGDNEKLSQSLSTVDITQLFTDRENGDP